MVMVDSESSSTNSSAPAPVAALARPPLPRWTVPVVALLVLGLATVASVLLWQWVDGLAFADTDKKSAAHLDVLKLAASIAVGGGGLFALYLAARRQRTQELELAQRERAQAHTEQVAETSRVHAERVAEATERDAAARRVTDLFTKSVEQLGSDKAAVRLGGMYALERLAQDNPEQRATVVNVFCAYLRMPFKPPGTPPEPEDGDTDYKAALVEHGEQVQEREVRVAAQRILRDHLRKGSEEDPPVTYWPDTDLDLTGANLIDFDLSRCTVRSAIFASATFTGHANFQSVTFTRTADFQSVTFTRTADFESVTFTRTAYFDSATFTDTAYFNSATFTNNANFTLATFTRTAYFNSATFTNNANFQSATFTRTAYFNSATFTNNADFESATFTDFTDFTSATFTGSADFTSATFTGSADFTSATSDRGVPPEIARFIPPAE
jgi:hypothetical protein